MAGELFPPVEEFLQLGHGVFPQYADWRAAGLRDTHQLGTAAVMCLGRQYQIGPSQFVDDLDHGPRLSRSSFQLVPSDTEQEHPYFGGFLCCLRFDARNRRPHLALCHQLALR